MKKTIVTVLVLLAVITMTAAASGVQENPATNRARSFTPPYVNGEELSITGTLKIVSSSDIELITDKGTYNLMYPYYNTPDIDVKDGQEITVKGYEVPAYRWSNGNDGKFLHVEEATVDGKTYSFDNYYGMRGNRMPARSAGRMGGRSGGRNTGNWNNSGSRQRGGGRW